MVTLAPVGRAAWRCAVAVPLAAEAVIGAAGLAVFATRLYTGAAAAKGVGSGAEQAVGPSPAAAIASRGSTGLTYARAFTGIASCPWGADAVEAVSAIIFARDTILPGPGVAGALVSGDIAALALATRRHAAAYTVDTVPIRRLALLVRGA
jgi:hypothetical protein